MNNLVLESGILETQSLKCLSMCVVVVADAELKGLDDAEKEDYILSKMRKIQIEYKHMSSLYNKLTRRSNRASNRKKVSEGEQLFASGQEVK